jgi:anti-sigma B factor antagonist
MTVTGELPVVHVVVDPVAGIDVVSVVGSLDLQSVPRIKDLVLDLSRCTQPVLVLDLNQVDLLDSQGIAAIVTTRRRVAARGGELVLACRQPHLLKLLRISRLDTVLRVVGGVEELLARDDAG